MRTVETARFGTLEIQEDAVIRFPKGLPAFEEHQEWVFVGEDDNPFKWFQSLLDGEVALPVCSPRFVDPNYRVRVSAEGLPLPGGVKEEDFTLVVVLTIPPHAPWSMTANLQAPILVDHVNRTGIQVLLPEEDYGVRHPVFPPDPGAGGPVSLLRPGPGTSSGKQGDAR